MSIEAQKFGEDICNLTPEEDSDLLKIQLSSCEKKNFSNFEVSNANSYN